MQQTNRKAQIHKLLKHGIEDGDESAIEVISPDKYIQHNPQTEVERSGLAQLFKRLSETGPRVNIVRTFADGDYVFAHTEYDFSQRNIGFEIFRFDGEHAVEHWDNIQPRMGPNLSGRSMVDGSAAITDYHLTDHNRALVERYVDEVLIARKHASLGTFVAPQLIEHNPARRDGVESLENALAEMHESYPAKQYRRRHRVLSEGNFVLSVSEGDLAGVHSSFYDLFRVEQNLIVEHWDTVEAIPAKHLWKNDNGKF